MLKEKKYFPGKLIVVLSSFCISFCACQSEMPSLKIAYNSWVGFGPLFIAQEMDFFENENIKVELILMEGTGEKGSALSAGRIEGIATTLDAFVIQASKGVPGIVVMGFDESLGADGVVTTKDIENIKDIRGKKVALQPGFVGHFFLLYLLDEVGLGPDSIQVEPMNTGDAGAAFVAGKVDAAVTWEPWLSKALERENGHILITSKEKPGLIADVLVIHKDVLEKRENDVRKMIKGWYKAVDYWKEHPAEANKIIAKAFEISIDEVNEMLSGLIFFDEKKNLEYFGSKENPGLIYKVADTASKVWLKEGLIESSVDPKRIIDPSVIQK